MLRAIKRFFDANIQPASPAETEHRLRLATAALLIEMSRMNDEFKPEERDTIVRAIRDKFTLPPGETEELIRLAEAESQEATDYFQFTSLINRGFNQEQKEKVIEYMWEVAYADGELDKHEHHLMRKIGDLLYISQKAFLAAKDRARRSVTGD